MDRHKKAIFILGGVTLVGVVFYLYSKSKSTAAATTANPNLVMVSSANVQIPQDYGYLNALSAESHLSKELSMLMSQPGKVGTPTAPSAPTNVTVS